MKSRDEAVTALIRAWPSVIKETRQVLGSELHYQAVIYHCLRLYGGIPLEQIGMNVKMWIANPATELFQNLDKRKEKGFHGGFEPIPDVCVFSEAVGGDWRRRNNEKTLESMLLAFEVKASERAGSRLRPGEIIGDTLKLKAHREESRGRKGDFVPVMMVIDTAPLVEERMTLSSLKRSRLAAHQANVEFLYVSQDSQICSLTGT
ncbi:hypothetical protein NZK33_20700 [Cyanobium sp. FGCU-6]|nr:hypothetical protein [Cyanobium sp. FGCU6]